MKNRTLLPLLLALASLPALAQSPDNPECLGSNCGRPKEEGGGGGGACVDGVCTGGGCSVWVAYTDDGKTLAYTDDADGDGRSDTSDNCPFASNREQLDGDGDGVGDRCDTCAAASNFDQLDTDGDGRGDACDDDLDGDGVLNALDRCPRVSDAAQLDTDGDQLGNACDGDDDGDGLADVTDLCPLLPNPGNAPLADPRCNADQDGDNVSDTFDNCLAAVNPGQADLDLDGQGDVCDLDRDDDGILDSADNCPGARNRGQWDEDADGVGEACDPHYCVVIDPTNREDCLDPNGPFRVHGGGHVTLKAGEQFRLPLFANRNGAAIEYAWTVARRPAGSKAAITSPVGVVTQSNRWMYAYPQGEAPTFTADVDGEYALQLQAHLVFADRAYPAQRDSTSSLQMNALGREGASCAAVPVEGLFALAALTLLRRGRTPRSVDAAPHR
ncbi:MAG: cell-cell cohesion MYXO-CTERM protein MtsC [Myxococcota bacterium]